MRLAMLSLLTLAAHLPAETFRHLTFEPAAGARVEANGDYKEGKSSHRAIYKPDPRADWCKLPWIANTEAYKGKHAIGLEVLRKPATDMTETDKVNLTLSTGRDKFALTFGSPRFTGFAVKLPSKTFEVPEQGRGIMIAQWWQGKPYGPPLRLAISSTPVKKGVAYELHVKNDDTLGNPSAKDVTIGGGVIPYDVWNAFVVYAAPDFTGKKGEVRVWMNGKEQLAWKGKLGYDPAGKPYKGATNDTPNPNPNFDIFFGPYRNRQNRQHQVYFDEIKLASTYAEALP